jgi:small multidrug resistance pump
MGYVYLLIAIVAEVIATSLLKSTAEFTRFWPSVVVVAGYCASFYFLTLAMRTIPVGVSYAIWSGLGIVLITGAAVAIYRQVPDLPALIGMGLIVAGVVVIQLFSKMEVH